MAYLKKVMGVVQTVSALNWQLQDGKGGKMNRERKLYFPQKYIVEKIKKIYPEGTKVKLLQMEDAQAPSVGTYGTVTRVDDIGTIHVYWDNGSCLGVVYGEGKVEKAVFTSIEDIVNTVLADYNHQDVEFSTAYLEFNVKMPIRDILKSYGRLQHMINGDEIVECREDGAEIWYDEEDFASDLTEVYSGRMDKLLERFDGSKRFLRYDEDEVLDFVF